MTNIHFHFPIEVNFFLGDKKNLTQADWINDKIS